MSAWIVLQLNGVRRIHRVSRATELAELPVSRRTLQSSTALGSNLHYSTIRGCLKHNSSHHPIHACAHSRLDLCGVGSGVGVGVGVCARVSCGVSSWCLQMMWDACMDGSRT